MVGTRGYAVRNLATSGGPGRYTNCEDCKHTKPTITFVDRDPVQFSCRDAIDEDAEVSDTVVSLDYEALIPWDGDEKEAVRVLETSLLTAASRGTGLNECDLDSQYSGGMRRLAELPRYLTLYGLHSKPPDNVYSGMCERFHNYCQ